MAIDTDAKFSVRPDEAQAKKPRRKAGDRPQYPPELGLRASRYDIAWRLNQHFTQARNDADYGLRWNLFRADALRERAIDLEKMSKKRAKVTKDEPTMRVRASELKACARAVTMRLIGFEGDPVGADSPQWNLSAVYGENVHFEVETALAFLRLVKRSEFYLRSPDGNLGGMADDELNGAAFEFEGVALPDAILDVKSVGTDEYKKGWNGDKIPDYIKQITAYARITGATVGVILLADRGSGKFEDVEFDIDPDYGDKMHKRATIIVEKYAKRKQLPKPEAKERGKWMECNMFCPFKALCERQEADGSVQDALDEGTAPKDI